ncbi:hypothetical protein VNO77_18916 [Canavalia gladiata]|uniref:Uncharacterized protein n=1 Tax=Canavalia gladiata TaxID=3824 RepID=A0AAN9LLL3_CANGL
MAQWKRSFPATRSSRFDPPHMHFCQIELKLISSLPTSKLKPMRQRSNHRHGPVVLSAAPRRPMPRKHEYNQYVGIAELLEALPACPRARGATNMPQSRASIHAEPLFNKHHFKRSHNYQIYQICPQHPKFQICS